MTTSTHAIQAVSLICTIATIVVLMDVIMLDTTSMLTAFSERCRGASGGTAWVIGAENTTLCDDGKVCTRDMYSTDFDFCYSAPYQNSERCNSTCLVDAPVASHCDADTGECVTDDPTECRSYCPDTNLLNSAPAYSNYTEPVYCWQLFPTRDEMGAGSSYDQYSILYHDELLDPPMKNNGTDCYYNQCVRMGMVILPWFLGTNETWYGDFFHVTTNGEFLDCMDYMDLQNRNYTDPSCIVARSFEVHDVGLSQYMGRLLNKSPGLVLYTGLSSMPSPPPVYGQLSEPYNASIPVKFCVFRYACGRFNTTTLSAAAAAAAATATASTPYQGIIKDSVDEVGAFFGTRGADALISYRFLEDKVHRYVEDLSNANLTRLFPPPPGVK